jgi:hypothetical protein
MKSSRFAFVKVYLNNEELELLKKLAGDKPHSKFFRELLNKEKDKNTRGL